jgi:hypothetical protein
MTSPFQGYQLGATARMLDLQVLPTQALGLPNLPTALAQVALGEQVARAYAPAGGVVCRTSEQPAPPPTPKPQGRTLAYTTMAYKTIPLFWTGTAMLLIGVVLVAALPRVRTFAPVGPWRSDDGEPDAAAEEPSDVESADAETTGTADEPADSETEAAAAEPAGTGATDSEPSGSEAISAETAGGESSGAEVSDGESVSDESAEPAEEIAGEEGSEPEKP